MKKIFSLILSAVMLLSVVSLAGCGKPQTLKFGMGVDSYINNPTSAEADKNGSAEAVTAVAAVLLDNEGKIVKCVFDVAANKLEYTADGKFVEAKEFKTKYELGDNYGMKAYGGAKKEWYEQADAFAALVVGKTITDVKALIATDGKGTDDVINAGCTIYVSDFINSIEKAVNNAKESSATAEDTLKLGFVSTQTGSKDATAEADGVNEVDTTVVASAVNKDGKVTATVTDAVQAKATFNNKGETKLEKSNPITTKKDAGDNYGMKAYGGAKKEWYEQADAFDAACVGKNADEIAKLAIDSGYGTDDLQTAGCTIHIGDMVKAAVKAATVK